MVVLWGLWPYLFISMPATARWQISGEFLSSIIWFRWWTDIIGHTLGCFNFSILPFIYHLYDYVIGLWLHVTHWWYQPIWCIYLIKEIDCWKVVFYQFGYAVHDDHNHNHDTSRWSILIRSFLACHFHALDMHAKHLSVQYFM